MFRTIILGVALVLCAAGAEAQDEAPLAIENMTEAAEARVVLPQAARDHPKLREEMADRGRERLEAFVAEAEEARREAETDASIPWMPWSLDYVYVPRYVGPVFASFLVNIFTYQGGAHPLLEFDVVNRDLELNEPVSLADLFIDAGPGSPALVALSEHVKADIARQKAERMGEPVDLAEADWAEAVAPDPENFELFTFEPSRQEGLVAGLTFHFPPYAVGAYAEGPYEVFVPASVFDLELAGYFPQIFGGEPVSLTHLSSYEDPGTFVLLEAPQPDAEVSSPVAVSGELPAGWLDRGEVAVRLEDYEGNVLAESVAEPDPPAPTSGISPGMVAFRATLTFETPAAQEGQIVFSSGGEEIAAGVRF